VTTDESSYLTPYYTSNIAVMYEATVKNQSLQFTGQCNNLGNRQFEIVNGRPMPGINWLAGVKMTLR